MNDRSDRPSQPPWDPAILAAERAREAPSPQQQAALLARLERSFAASAEGGDGASIDRAASGASAPVNASTALRTKALTAAIVYALGVATGALAHALLSRADSAPPAAAAAAPRVDVALADAALDAVITQTDRDASTRSPDAARLVIDASSARPRARDSNDLIAETNVIEMARSALARGRASAALDALERHRVEFARGQLAEDRESLAIEALVTVGRNDEARRRAESFVRRWPDGMYRPRVDAALALIR